MTRNEEKIYQLCKTADADINLCRVVYSIIENAPKKEQAALLESFVIYYKNTPSDRSLKLPEFMAVEEREHIRKKYGPLVDNRMMTLLEMGLSEKEFYSKLWTYLSTTSLLPNYETRIVCFYNCIIDKCLPYFVIDRSAALSMEQDEYIALHAAIGEKNIAQMEYILDADDFEQKTERASLLISIMDSLKSFEERTVFLARLISHANTGRMRMSGVRRRPLFPFGDSEDEDILSGVSLSDLFSEDDDDDGDDEDSAGTPVF